MSRKQEFTGIRSVCKADLKTAHEIYTLSFPDRKKSTAELEAEILGGSWPDKLAWMYIVRGNPVGFAWALRVPGLDGCYDLQGCVHPEHRRKGFGSDLLSAVLKDLRRRDVKRAAWMTGSETDPGSTFLLKRGFSLEHREWIMELSIHAHDTVYGHLPEGFFITNYSIGEAISNFRALYDRAFSKLLWYQPYESDAEVSRDLINPAHLLFLVDQDDPVGFCWQRFGSPDRADIEPIGLLPAYQGRGLGRQLLLEAVKRISSAGISRVRLGVWEENEAAVRLYLSTGFRKVKTVSYYAVDLHSNI